MIGSIIDIFEIERIYRKYLLERDVKFDKLGRPIFQASMFLKSAPDMIVTFGCRNNPRLVKDPLKTAICFFAPDSDLYPRLEKVFDELDEYKRFLAVVTMDLTFTADMDVELQHLIVSINQLFSMILAINGIKLIQNTRSGGLNCTYAFTNVPTGISVASGFLGCSMISENNLSYISKILFLLPSQIFIYGKHDAVAEAQLDQFGFTYRSYTDMHRLIKNKEVYYG
ncbi:MAG: hypothetical protein J6Y08_02235 [Clostridiales bacterium]|nr:hypothetical protein [Clostridiales bacterium]